MVEKKEIVWPNLIEEIMKLAISGDFGAGEIEDLVADGEKVIGEMNSFEKACYITMIALNCQAEERRDQGMSEGGNVIQAILRKREAAKNLMWCSIVERYPSDVEHGVRNEWKIVEFKKKECACPACQLKRELRESGMLGAIATGRKE